MSQEAPPRPAQFTLGVVHIYDDNPSPDVTSGGVYLAVSGVYSAACIQAFEGEGDVGYGDFRTGIGPGEGARGRGTVPLWGSGGAVAEVRPAAKTIDGMLVANGGIVDGEEEGEFGFIDGADVAISVQFGAVTDESGWGGCNGAPGADDGEDD